jgi:hypothetical protein
MVQFLRLLKLTGDVDALDNFLALRIQIVQPFIVGKVARAGRLEELQQQGPKQSQCVCL